MRIRCIFFLLFFTAISSCKENIKSLESEADGYYKRNNFVKSIAMFTELIELDSTNGTYYFKRGYSYAMLLNADDAIKDYLKAIDLGYRKPSAYLNIGINYSTLNDSLAIYYFNKCLEYDPNNIKAKKKIEECKKLQHLRKRIAIIYLFPYYYLKLQMPYR